MFNFRGFFVIFLNFNFMLSNFYYICLVMYCISSMLFYLY
ncbi:Conserved hypothetical protein part 2, CAP domain [Clostridium neonatale]|nr:Conserved hypothetical protein part 2, CAP domain [Clostridium neonatale]